MRIDSSIPIIPVSILKNEGIDEAIDALLEILYR